MTGLTISASSLQSGSSVVVDWIDTNTGTLPAAGSFTDLIAVTNSTTGQVLDTADVPYNATVLGDLAAGTSAPQQYYLRLPDGSAGVGQIQFTVTTDVNDNVSTGQGDPGKTATSNETSTLANYADLVVASGSLAVTPMTPQSGGSATVTWNDLNQGDAAVNGA